MIRADWNPSIYLSFAAYRARPAEDLIARLDLNAPGAIFDLGCGPGTLTRKLKDRWPAHAVIGVDSSPAMLAEAGRKYGERDIAWHAGDIGAWTAAEPAALVFANAALHWVPDHEALFPRLMKNVEPGGLLAVQMPLTAEAPYHACIRRTLDLPRWRARLADVPSHDPPGNAASYYDLVSPFAAHVDIWNTRYHHVLADASAVTAWASGTALVPYLTALDSDPERQGFLSDFTVAAATAYRPQPDGKVLFTMDRLFIVAERSAA